MMDKALRVFALVLVLALGIPPFLEVATIGNILHRIAAGAFLGLAVAVGAYAALSLRPPFARFTTITYGVFGLGFGLFVAGRPLSNLLAYVVALLAMNVVLYHVATYGPVLRASRDEDAITRRARAATGRSLVVSGLALTFSYGGSLALLPLFAIESGSTHPIVALGLAVALVLILMTLVVLPESATVREVRPSRPS